jgi:adenylate cyclase
MNDKNQRAVRKITALCSDLRAFSEFYDDLKPLELADLMDTHYADAAAIITEEGGKVDKFIGDSVLAHFGSDDAAHPEAKAVNAAIRLKAKVAERWPDLPISIGIATGEAVVGQFGPAAHRFHTAFGDVITRAVQLERRSHITGFKILVDEDTRAKLGKQVHVDEHSTRGNPALDRTKVFEIGLRTKVAEGLHAAQS